MKRKITDKTKIIAAFVLLLLVAIVADFMGGGEIKDGAIERDKIGGEEKKLQLELDIDGVGKDYEYSLEVLPIAPTQEEAEGYFEEAIALIEQDFAAMEEAVPVKETYLDGVVEADWSFQPFGLIDTDGQVYYEKLEEEETVIEAQVELSCGDYERIYTFRFLLLALEKSEEEQILEALESWMEQQMAMEGSAFVQLPTEIAGKSLLWSENREYLTPQIFLLECVAVVLLWVISRRKRLEDEKKRILDMERDYPDVVYQLSILLGAGMTTRQAWNRLAKQYTYKRKHEMIEERVVYEAILRMNRRFAEGESERIVYQQFTEEVAVACYHKLIRILLGSLEKGTEGICTRLEEESRLAFEQKILQAKKQGEEASTKMLVPLMLMMTLVMGDRKSVV